VNETTRTEAEILDELRALVRKRGAHSALYEDLAAQREALTERIHRAMEEESDMDNRARALHRELVVAMRVQ
jgi:seryl-tRNA synthetase